MTSEKALLSQMSERFCIFNDAAMGITLNEIQEDIRLLIADCQTILSKCNENDLKKQLTSFYMNWDLLYQSLEMHVVDNCYEMIFFKIGVECQVQDSDFENISTHCKHITLHQLSVDFKYGLYLPEAITEYEMISAARTPIEKIQCLVRTIRILSRAMDSNELKSGSPTVLTSDQLIPLFILLILQSNVINLPSNLAFIKKFTFEKEIAKGEVGYALSSLEAVLGYTKSHFDELAMNSVKSKTFYEAIESGSLEVLESLFANANAIDNQSFVNFTSNAGNNAIMIAVEMGHLHLIDFLISKGFNSNHQNFEGETVLHICAKENVCEPISKVSCDLNAQDRKGWTALHLSIMYNSLAVSRLLISPSNINAVTYLGESALFFALKKEGTDLLLSHGANPGIMSRSGTTPLLEHCLNANIESALAILEYCLSDPVQVVHLEFTDLRGRTFLHIASHANQMPIIKAFGNKLQKNKILVPFLHKVTYKQNTSLHAAAFASHLGIVRELLNLGANPNAINGQGYTASELSKNDKVRHCIEGFL